MRASKSLNDFLKNYSIISFTKKATFRIEELSKQANSKHLLINTTGRTGLGYEFNVTSIDPKTNVYVETQYVNDNLQIYLQDHTVMQLWNSTLDYDEDNNCFKEV